MKAISKELPGWYLLKYDTWVTDNDNLVYSNICLYRFRPMPTNELGKRLANLIYRQFNKKKIPEITIPIPGLKMKPKKHYPNYIS